VIPREGEVTKPNRGAFTAALHACVQIEVEQGVTFPVHVAKSCVCGRTKSDTLLNHMLPLGIKLVNQSDQLDVREGISGERTRPVSTHVPP
jgi:hypothetical protein